jgi:hypothetical protein
MILALEFAINKIYRKDLTLLYGENTKVIVEDIKYVTNQKKYLITCKLHIGVIYESELHYTYPTGLNDVILCSCRLLGLNPGDYIINSTID